MTCKSQYKYQIVNSGNCKHHARSVLSRRCEAKKLSMSSNTCEISNHNG